DDLLIAAAATGSNAVALTPTQLVQVYQCSGGATDWHDFNSSAPVGSTIIPEIPQSGSGTGDTFRNDLAAANGGTAVTLGSCVKTVEENDPTAITGASTPANAIAPFSSGRKALYDTAPGYFKDPTVAFPGPGGFLSSGIQLLYGTQTAGSCVAPTNPPGAGNSVAYCNTRGLYIAWRQSDTTASGGWQPGSSRNWVQTLFWRASGDGKSFIQTTGGQADIAAGGATPTWVDCGFGTSVTSC
ncbi:MAG: hypothetical protein JO222_02075, partial [Frankiales bacterium]|nr:hypothetical protein [Frankiales bacterium]